MAAWIIAGWGTTIKIVITVVITTTAAVFQKVIE